MNILFITNKNVNPVIGGIERITYVLAEAFARLHGHRCFSAFTQRLDNCATPFVEELLLEVGHDAWCDAHVFPLNFMLSFYDNF